MFVDKTSFRESYFQKAAYGAQKEAYLFLSKPLAPVKALLAVHIIHLLIQIAIVRTVLKPAVMEIADTANENKTSH